MSRIFITGASGYIGGQVLHALVQSHPDCEIAALVRDTDKAAIIRDRFPQISTVIGDLDNDALLEQEASKASLVLHLAATGHLKSVQAIHRGLTLRESSEPAYWIQVSGASALAAAEIASPDYIPGSSSDSVYDDESGIADIRAVIQAHPFRAVDNFILNTVAESSNIRSALVFPPIIYGQGQGPINQRSIQVPELSRVTLEKKHGVRIGEGSSRWGNVHIRDIGSLFLALAEAALARRDDEQLWGKNGLYLTGVGELSFAEISAQVAQAACQQGHISDQTVVEIQREEYDTALPHGKVLFGTNARSNARRGRQRLQWEPKELSLEEDILRTVAEEAAKQSKQ